MATCAILCADSQPTCPIFGLTFSLSVSDNFTFTFSEFHFHFSRESLWQLMQLSSSVGRCHAASDCLGGWGLQMMKLMMRGISDIFMLFVISFRAKSQKVNKFAQKCPCNKPLKLTFGAFGNCLGGWGLQMMLK